MHIYAYNLIGINSRHTSDTISFSIFFHPRKSRYQQSNRFTKSVTRPAGKLITSLIKIEKLWRAIETDRILDQTIRVGVRKQVYIRVYIYLRTRDRFASNWPKINHNSVDRSDNKFTSNKWR